MRPSASGVLLQGFDYQHLFAWYQALLALDPERDVTGIAVEAEGAGNVDDVVVRRAHAADTYYQVKYSVDAQHPIDTAWWIRPATPNGKSPLKRFWESWHKLSRAGHRPQMGLYTNRVLDVSDPVLALRDGQLGRLGPKLRIEKPRSKARRGLQQWAAHLDAPEGDLLEMLDHLELLTDQGPWAGLATSTADRMAAVGLKSDELSIEQGVAAIRSWVTTGQREIDRRAIRTEVERRGLLHGERRATLVIHGIDHHPWPGAGTVSLDWVDLFNGRKPEVRRQLVDPGQWNGRLLPELEAAERQVRQLGFNRVLVRGYMRLPAWFATGAVFADTRGGYRLECDQRDEVWSTAVRPAACAVQEMLEELGAGPDLAIGLSVARPVLEDVRAYVHAEQLPVKRVLHIAVREPGPQALPDAAAAAGWATTVRNCIAAHARETGARRAHLFLAVPAGAALFLGHWWNRLPAAQLYEDLNQGYAPAFLIER